MQSVVSLHNHLIKHWISRDDLIVACGGGVTSDIVGFAASTALRGVRWGICATTLLGMVDASIGGKTGVNHSDGKNLIGSYWQPSFVIDDLEWLETLPIKEYRSGMAEVIKSAGLAGGKLLRQLSQVGDRLLDVEQPELVDLVAGTVAYKAGVVRSDERDTGVRLRLNFGHTIGHAIEQSLSFKRLTHGEAVILGMLGAMAIADRLGLSQAKRLGEFRRIVMGALSDVPSVRLDPDRILSALALDKKRTTKGTRFVLLPQPGHPIVRLVSKKEVTGAVEAMIQIYHAR
jgi:3-dehydroquinate synthase